MSAYGHEMKDGSSCLPAWGLCLCVDLACRTYCVSVNQFALGDPYGHVHVQRLSPSVCAQEHKNHHHIHHFIHHSILLLLLLLHLPLYSHYSFHPPFYISPSPSTYGNIYPQTQTHNPCQPPPPPASSSSHLYHHHHTHPYIHLAK